MAMVDRQQPRGARQGDLCPLDSGRRLRPYGIKPGKCVFRCNDLGNAGAERGTDTREYDDGMDRK